MSWLSWFNHELRELFSSESASAGDNIVWGT